MHLPTARRRAPQIQHTRAQSTLTLVKFSVGFINPGLFFMAEFGPNSPLREHGRQPVQPAANWATTQAMPQAMGLLLLPWGDAAQCSDLLVLPEDHLQKEG